MSLRSGVFLSLSRLFRRLAGGPPRPPRLPHSGELARDEESFPLGAYRSELVDGGTLEDHLTRDALTYDPTTGLATIETYAAGGSVVVRMDFLAEVARLWDASFAVRLTRAQGREELAAEPPSDQPLPWRRRQ